MKRLVMAAAILAASVSAQAGCRMQANDSLEFKGDKQAHLVWSAIPGAAVVLGNDWLGLGMSKTAQFGVAMIPARRARSPPAAAATPVVASVGRTRSTTPSVSALAWLPATASTSSSSATASSCAWSCDHDPH